MTYELSACAGAADEGCRIGARLDCCCSHRFLLLAIVVNLVLVPAARGADQSPNRFEMDRELPSAADGVAIGLHEDDEDLSRDEEEEKEEDQFTPIVEELFLGVIVYPQEQDEVQLTLGYFDGVEAVGNSTTLFEIEYGITDRLQVGFEVPIESAEDEPFDGVRNLGLELYHNFYSNLQTGRAYGAGFELGLPIDSEDGESRAWVYEPFVVAYQDYRAFAVNVSAAAEVEDPLGGDDSTDVAGEVAVGIIGKTKKFVPLLELEVEIESESTPVRLAAGLYCKSFMGPVDAAVSFPLGLNDDAPEFAAYFLAIMEFDAEILRPRSFR